MKHRLTIAVCATAIAASALALPASATTAPHSIPADAAPVGLSCTGYFNTSIADLAAGQSKAAPSAQFWFDEAGTIDACLDGPHDADFDLVLQQHDPARAWITVATAPAGGADKILSYTGPATTYRLLITANSGSGTYTVGLNRPGFSR